MRFSGDDGQAARVEALAEQELVAHDPLLAQRLAGLVVVRDWRVGDQLFTEDDREPRIFFIFSGAIELSVEGRAVARLEAGQALGEFTILGPRFAQRHHVNAKVVRASIVAEMPAGAFATVADEHPRIWKAIARSLADRLDKRNRSSSDLAAATAAGSALKELGEVRVKHLWQAVGWCRRLMGV